MIRRVGWSQLTATDQDLQLQVNESNAIGRRFEIGIAQKSLPSINLAVDKLKRPIIHAAIINTSPIILLENANICI